jgi:hypothetical protein
MNGSCVEVSFEETAIATLAILKDNSEIALSAAIYLNDYEDRAMDGD